MKKIVYPGTFDPITLGHIDLIERALRIFDKVSVAIAADSQKNTLFTLDARVKLAKKALGKYKNVEVCSFSGLLIDFARKKNIMVVLRGLRAVSDFEYELQLASMNRVMEPKIDTVFLTPAEKYAYVTASMVREIACLGGDVSRFVPKNVEEALKSNLKLKMKN